MSRPYLSSPERQQAILTAAHNLLIENGLAALTMPNLAAASGLSIGGLYRHFPSREDVLHSLIIADAKQLMIELQKFVIGKTSLQERLTSWCLTQINREIREGTLKLRLEILSLACRDEVLRMSLLQYENELSRQLRSMLMQAPEGSPARSNPQQSQELLCVLIDGLATRGAIFNETLRSSRSLIKRTVETLLDIHYKQLNHG